VSVESERVDRNVEIDAGARERVAMKSARLQKAPTGIPGLDEITVGGLPQGRPTLICGAAGSGKTLMAMQFLVGGALQYSEPGVFVSFEETEDDLATNVASLLRPIRAADGRRLSEYVAADAAK